MFWRTQNRFTGTRGDRCRAQGLRHDTSYREDTTTWLLDKLSLSDNRPLARRTRSQKLNVTVDSRHLDRRSARADLRVEVLPVELAEHCDISDVGVNASINAGHIEIGVQVLGKEKLYAAVDTAHVYA